MKTTNHILSFIAWAVALAALVLTSVAGCTSCGKAEIVEDISDEGLLRNDDLIAVRTDNGRISIKNAATGVTTIKDIKLD